MKGDTNGGATGVACGDGADDGGRDGGDNADCQGRGGRLKLASFSSRRVLLAPTLLSCSATMASVRCCLTSSIVICVVAMQEKTVGGLGEPRA
jgi:hypothetical protein